MRECEVRVTRGEERHVVWSGRALHAFGLFIEDYSKSLKDFKQRVTVIFHLLIHPKSSY